MTLDYSKRMNTQPVAATPNHNARPATPVARKSGAVAETLCVTLRCAVKWNTAAATSSSIFTWNVPFAPTEAARAAKSSSPVAMLTAKPTAMARLAGAVTSRIGRWIQEHSEQPEIRHEGAARDQSESDHVERAQGCRCEQRFGNGSRNVRRLEPREERRERHSLTVRNRSALPITDTEDMLIARLAIIGESSSPKAGYNRPAASGTPSAL